MSKLYLVPTPIGNLGDITLRAIEVLNEVDLVLAEDTRKSGILLKHFQISKPVHSHHKFNEHRTIESLVQRLLGGTSIALITDAGTPGISGFLPQKKGRQKRLTELAAETRTMVLYESPHRLVKTLSQMAEHFGPDRKGSVSRELTKVHEETQRGTLEELALYFSKGTVKGEIVLVVEGS